LRGTTGEKEKEKNMDAKSLTLPPDSIPPLEKEAKQKSEPKGLIELSHETFVRDPRITKNG